MKLQRIEIRKLFHLYDHTIELKPERATIVHGPNGVGKTALLKLVAAFFQNQTDILFRYPFEIMHFTFSSEDYISLQRKGNTIRVKGFIENQEHEASFNKKNPGGSMDGWFASGDDVLKKEAWFLNLQAKVRVRLIDTQRLLSIHEDRFGKPPLLPSFEGQKEAHLSEPVYPSVLKKPSIFLQIVQSFLAEYGKKTSHFDQSFPERLLKEKQDLLSSLVLKEKMEEIQEKREDLQQLGILQANGHSPFDVAALDDLDASERKVMTMYVQDNLQKLSVFDLLLQKLHMFLEHINKNFRKKKLSFDPSKGFLLKDTREETLELDSLSSGEQHEFVLFFEFLFEVEPQTLVLLDEPEISLHIAWQKDFLPTLLKTVKICDFDVLLATHSPYIVGDRFDLMVELDAEEDKPLPS